MAQVFAARHSGKLRSLCLTNCETHDNVPPEAFKLTADLAASGALAAGPAALLADPEVAPTLVFGSGYEDVTHLDLELLRSVSCGRRPGISAGGFSWRPSAWPCLAGMARDLIGSLTLMSRKCLPARTVDATN